ncbi:MAG TPA: FAD-dependent oxidoreductase [Rubrobacteraceae bacterium]|nr:FAD-dependent oxidoreductase [Rubrobacteraceae bacterium]
MRALVAGGGLAGLVAAARLRELGASVTLLEKGDAPGGSLIYSSGFVWSYRDLETHRREAPQGDAELQNLILERLGEGLAWLEGVGAPVLARETGNPLTFGARFDPERTVAALVDRLAATGGKLLTRAALRGLARDADGRVTGARVVAGGEEATHGADAVLLASGGFAANEELVARHIVRGPGKMRLRAHPRSTGDGLLAALEAGALPSKGFDEFYGRNLPAPPADFSPEQFVEVSQLYGRHAVALNRRGQRYADEAADWSETALTQSTARQPGLRGFYVLDADGLKRRVRHRTVEEMVATARRVGGTVLVAESLGGLAEQLAERGVPAAQVRRTIEEYNRAVENGRGGELSPPRSEPAAPVRRPPFVAVEIASTITHTIGGLAVDRQCRVLQRSDGRPLPGLYAAGVEVGGVSAGGYTSGLAAALVFGRVAATTAVKDAETSD